MTNNKPGFSTQSIHAGQKPDPTNGAIMTPIYLSSTYVQSSPGVHTGYEYSRTGNPTRKAFEDCLAALEGGIAGFAFASGCSATSIVLSMLQSGDHVIAMDDLYGGTVRQFEKIYKNFGIEFEYVDLSNPQAIQQKMRSNTRLVWLETPTNPLLKIADIAAISTAIKTHQYIPKIQHATTPHRALLPNRALVAVDNTFASPYFQRPLQLGADIVVHSATKYLGGHSDLVGGAVVVGTDDLVKAFAYASNSVGPVMSAFDAFLFLRSLKTLAVRMRAHEANAKLLALYLQSHPAIEQVIYPGLESHPQHVLAKKQMHGFGGMISIRIKGGINDSRKFLERVKLFALAESLGGVESLIEHPAIMTHASIPAEQRKTLGIDDNFVRLSVGIEDIEDLQADLNQALT